MFAHVTLFPLWLLVALSLVCKLAQAGATADYIGDYTRIMERMKLQPHSGVFRQLVIRPHKELLTVTGFFDKWASAKRAGPAMMSTLP